MNKKFYIRPVGAGYGETVDPGPLLSLADAKKELSRAARIITVGCGPIFRSANGRKVVIIHVGCPLCVVREDQGVIVRTKKPGTLMAFVKNARRNISRK